MSRKFQSHPFDMDESQIDLNLIYDKKERKVDPRQYQLYARLQSQQPQTSMKVSALTDTTLADYARTVF